MMTNYKEFYKRYVDSGLTQRAFAKQEGLSVGSVSYYLKRGREKETKARTKKATFSPIEIPMTSGRGIIIIRTASGIEIEIPI